MAYNVKEYGVVSTDSADLTSVAAPTRDDYYPTMYEVKKYVDSAVQGDTGDYITENELNTTLTNYATKSELLIDSIDGNSGVVTQELAPNKYYVFGTCTSLTITLGTPVENKLNEYMFEFTSGDTATVLGVPETIKWISEPNIEVNKTYQVSIVNNIGIIAGA